MNNINPSQGPLAGGFRNYNPSSMIIAFADDPVRSALFLLLIALFFIMLLTGGICIWPYLFTLIGESGGFDAGSAIGKLLLCGGISSLAGVLLSAYLCWFHNWQDPRGFSFSKIFMIIYIVEVVLSFLLVPALGVNMLGIETPNAWTNILGFLFHGMLGALICMVPSLLAAGIGFLVNRIACQILSGRERNYR